jgi:hypothetical protein
MLGLAWAQADSCSSSSGKTSAEHDVQNAGAVVHFLGKEYHGIISGLIGP